MGQVSPGRSAKSRITRQLPGKSKLHACTSLFKSYLPAHDRAIMFRTKLYEGGRTAVTNESVELWSAD